MRGSYYYDGLSMRGSGEDYEHTEVVFECNYCHHDNDGVGGTRRGYQVVVVCEACEEEHYLDWED